LAEKIALVRRVFLREFFTAASHELDLSLSGQGSQALSAFKNFPIERFGPHVFAAPALLTLTKLRHQNKMPVYETGHARNVEHFQQLISSFYCPRVLLRARRSTVESLYANRNNCSTSNQSSKRRPIRAMYQFFRLASSKIKEINLNNEMFVRMMSSFKQ